MQSLRLDARYQRIRNLTHEAVKLQVESAYNYLSELYNQVNASPESQDSNQVIEVGVKMNIILVGVGSLLDTIAYADYVFSRAQVLLRDNTVYFKTYKFNHEGLRTIQNELSKLTVKTKFWNAVNDAKHCTLCLDTDFSKVPAVMVTKELIAGALPLICKAVEIFSVVQY